MQTILANVVSNITSKPRRETLDGRSYLVVDGIGLVEDVLPGSDGPIFYPGEENVRNVDAWNGMPLTLYHPQISGKNISARNPKIIALQGLGSIFEAVGKDGKLGFQAWFDEEKTKSLDKRYKLNVYDRLMKGEPIGLSTGLFIDKYPAEEGAKYKDKPYQGVARNHRPDHVAVLPDMLGACTIDMGCAFNPKITKNDSGVLGRFRQAFRELIGLDGTKEPIASTTDPYQTNYFTDIEGDKDMKLNSQQRTETIALVGNCSCFKNDPKAQETLNAMSDELLVHLRQGVENERLLEVTTNTLRQIAKDAGAPADIKLNEMPEYMKKKMKDMPPDDDDDDENKKKGKNVSKNQAQTNDKGEKLMTEKEWQENSKPLSEEEWLAKAPLTVRERDKYATTIFNREKQRIAERLVAHIADPERKQAVYNALMQKSMEDLEERLELMPQVQVNQGLFPLQTNGNSNGNPLDDLRLNFGQQTKNRVLNYSGTSGAFNQGNSNQDFVDNDGIDPNDTMPQLETDWKQTVKDQSR